MKREGDPLCLTRDSGCYRLSNHHTVISQPTWESNSLDARAGHQLRQRILPDNNLLLCFCIIFILDSNGLTDQRPDLFSQPAFVPLIRPPVAGGEGGRRVMARGG